MHLCKLLIVDDDFSWLNLATRCFSSARYKVYSASSCAEGLKLYESHKPDCVLIDYYLGNANAATFCQHVRSAERTLRTPIVIISADDARETEAYERCQADGFISKASVCSKAITLINSLMRRVNWERGAITLGDLKLDSRHFQVFRNSSPVVKLSPYQFKFLYLLVQESPEFVSDQEIIEDLYGEEFAEDLEDSIRGIVQRLRAKLGPQLGRRIKNKSRRGWTYVQPHQRAKTSRTAASCTEANSQL